MHLIKENNKKINKLKIITGKMHLFYNLRVAFLIKYNLEFVIVKSNK